MKRFCIILFIVFISCTQGHTQNISVRDSVHTNKSLIFSFDEFSLGMLKNGLGGKYFINDKLALFTILNVDISRANHDASFMDEYNRNSYSTSLELGIENHIYLFKNISSPYYGASLGYGYTYNYNKYKNTVLISKGYNYEYIATIFFGVEYFPVRNISLSGRYTLASRWYYSKNEDLKNTSKNSGYNTMTSSSSLLLSFYF